MSCGLAGCATRDSGYRISDETIAFIEPGVTTRAEVIENLGQPLLEIEGGRVAAYSWGKMRAVASQTGTRNPGAQYSRMQMGYGAVPPPADEIALVEARRWIFCVALDEQGRVTRAERIKLEGAGSLEAAVQQWAAH